MGKADRQESQNMMNRRVSSYMLLIAIFIALSFEVSASGNRKLNQGPIITQPGPPGPQALPPQTAPPLPDGNAGLLPGYLRGETGLVINSPIDPRNLITPVQSIGLYVGQVGVGAYGSL